MKRFDSKERSHRNRGESKGNFLNGHKAKALVEVFFAQINKKVERDGFRAETKAWNASSHDGWSITLHNRREKQILVN